MSINFKNCSFKGYIPVSYFAKNPANNEYVPVIKNENIRKCNGFVVRNLNGTAKSNKNSDFVSEFKSYDKDYASVPAVKSVYDDVSPRVYLITGKDVDTVNALAKPVGVAKREACERTGKSKSFESKMAANNYFKQIRSFINYNCRRIKDKDGQPLSLNVYFNPEYTKNNSLKGFKYSHCEYVPSK